MSFNNPFDRSKIPSINSDLEKILGKIQKIHDPKERTILEDPIILRELAKINHALYLSQLEKFIGIIQTFIQNNRGIKDLNYEMVKMLEKRFRKDFKELTNDDQLSFLTTARTEIKTIVEMVKKMEKI